MNPDVRAGTKSVAMAIGLGLLSSKTLLTSRKRVKSALDAIPWIDSHSRADVRRVADEVIRGGITQDDIPLYVSRNVEPIMMAFNRAMRRKWSKTKLQYVKNQLGIQRERSDAPRVFYLVSSHQKPQPAHARYQGTVLIDRFWRMTVPLSDLPSVSAYVKNHKTETVQSAMGAPDYLIMRPNCRHRLIPVPTSEVLKSSARALSKKYNSGKTYVKRPISDKERYQAYKDLCSAIRSRLQAYARQKSKAGI